MNSVILIFCLAISACAQVDEPCSFSTSSIVTIGLKNYVCAKIVSGNETYIYSFPIVVDKLTVLSIKNMNSNLTNLQNATNANKNISLNLQFQNSAQVLELLISNSQAQVYRNLISIVIQASNGVMQSIINDSQDCTTCNIGTNFCYENECFNNGTLFDQSKLFIYVSWIGTDSNRQHMVSYTQRLSKLSRFSLSSIYGQAFNVY